MKRFVSGLWIGLGTFVVWGVASLLLLAIGMTTVEKGELGIYNYKPMFYGKSGIADTVVVGPQRVWAWPTTTIEKPKFTPVSLVIHAEDFMSRDRVPLDFDISVTIHLAETKKAPKMYREFGGDALQTFNLLVLQTDAKGKPAGELMSFLRDQIRHHDSSVFINAQSADGKASDEARDVEKNTIDYVNKFLADNGAEMVKVVNIALGRANPPALVLNEIVKTVAQAQEQKTQRAREAAAKVRKDAEHATAVADQAYINQIGLTPEQWIQLQTLRTIEKVCSGDKNSAHGNCMFVNGTGMSVAVPPPQTKATDVPAPETKSK